MKNVFITIPAFREHRNIVQLCEKIQLIDTKDYNFNILIVDGNENKWGTKFMGFTIKNPNIISKKNTQIINVSR